MRYLIIICLGILMLCSHVTAYADETPVTPVEEETVNIPRTEWEDVLNRLTAVEDELKQIKQDRKQQKKAITHQPLFFEESDD